MNLIKNKKNVNKVKNDFKLIQNKDLMAKLMMQKLI